MVLDKLLRMGEGRILRKLQSVADQVNALEEDFVGLTDAELRALTDTYRERLEDGETLDDLMPEAFATIREAAKRTLGQRHFDVQLMGGAALHLGNIAEMKTGEGKTLVGTLPAYLNGLSGKGVHIVTVNDYLARRDSEWMGRVHRFLGLSVGVIVANEQPAQRRESYACDITYGTNNEFGFDYLRDNMAWTADELVQRGHNFAIVDEVDSILIDEARTPLIISGPADQATKWYVEFARIMNRLQRDADYEVDEKKRTIAILEAGVAKIEDQLGIDNLYESVNTPLVGYVNNAIKAKELYKRDKDYVVMDGEVLIVDDFTGRLLAGRRYYEGMHQAIEAKEGVEIKQENQTLATITLQNYFRLYNKLGGMTGTASTEAAEFDQIYKLGVVPIPTNREPQRDGPDGPGLQDRGREVRRRRRRHRRAARARPADPRRHHVSVEKSELLSSMLLRRGRAARGAQREVPRAGGRDHRPGRAQGRGHRGDQHGRPWHRHHARRQPRVHRRPGAARHAACRRSTSRRSTRPPGPRRWRRPRAAVAAEHEEVVELGGLYVLGTERHESRRIDNQLRGRSGRQGDPGESRFYLSLQDDLMRLFNATAVERIMDTLNLPDDVPIESKMVSRAIRSAQTQIEQQNFEIRKNVLKYDEVLNKQRTVIYEERRQILHGDDLHEQISQHGRRRGHRLRRRGHRRGLPRGLGPRPALDRAQDALPAEPHDRGRRGRAQRPQPRPAGRDAHRERPQRLRRPRGVAGLRGHARAGAPGAAVGARPQVARAPLRDGLHAGGHRPARDGPARPAGRVPARGVHDVPGDARGHQGGVGRLPVQPRGRGQRVRPRRRRGDRGRRRRSRSSRASWPRRPTSASHEESGVRSRCAAYDGRLAPPDPYGGRRPAQGAVLGSPADQPVLLRTHHRR